MQIIPVITVMSIQIGAMVVGSVLVENVFALPGLGSLLINAINTSDYPIVQSVMLLLVAVFLILNLIVDIIYAIIDPRIRLLG
ncbi:ABC transporter permease subunit [Dorea sp.]|uniref:ABC transporter permease subunit n=1 Tax=Dorea sp. TaxID=2040332 RepID=UPI003528328D